MAKCIDLKRRLGKKYRIVRDPAYFAEYGKGAKTRDQWYDQIPCRVGHICPWGGKILAVSIDSRGSIAKRVAALSCTAVVQDADDGLTATFHVDDFNKIAKLVHPRTKRKVSPEQRAAFMARMAKLRA